MRTCTKVLLLENDGFVAWLSVYHGKLTIGTHSNIPGCRCAAWQTSFSFPLMMRLHLKLAKPWTPSPSEESSGRMYIDNPASSTSTTKFTISIKQPSFQLASGGIGAAGQTRTRISPLLDPPYNPSVGPPVQVAHVPRQATRPYAHPSQRRLWGGVSGIHQQSKLCVNNSRSVSTRSLVAFFQRDFLFFSSLRHEPHWALTGTSCVVHPCANIVKVGAPVGS